MTQNTSSNGPTSAATSTNEPTTQSEAEFLASEAAAARAAVQATLADLKHTVVNTVNVKQWTEQYPWIATSSALALGAVAGYLLTPRDIDEAKELWEKIKAKATAEAKDEDTKPSVLSVILREATKLIIPLVASTISEKGTEAQDPPQQTEG